MTKQRTLLTTLILGLTYPLFGQVINKDTVFIHKDSLLGIAQSIYFECNKNSNFYNNITNFSFSDFDNESYNNSIDYLKENKLPLTKRQPIISWTKWVTLKQYKGKLCVYKPCDFISHHRISFNDSTIIDWTGEGPIANKIIAQKKINNKTYEFKLTGIYNKERKLLIHIINKEKGIAIFEEITNGTHKNYYLMIVANKIKSVPLIVNNCATQKQFELNFDLPNYKELLITK